MIRCERFYAANDLRNFSYLIFNEKNGDAWVIDPYDAKPFIDYIKKAGLRLQGILNTHMHFDHIRGNEELVSTFNAPVKKLFSSETVRLNETNLLEVVDSPGHTMDHQVFVWRCGDDSPVLFSGDTIFNSGVGNCKNGGNVEALYATVSRLHSLLPLDTILQPGHDYLKRNLEFALHIDPDNEFVRERLKLIESDPLKRRPLTMKEEREINPFFRLDALSIQDKWHAAGKDLFIKLRSLRDNW